MLRYNRQSVIFVTNLFIRNSSIHQTELTTVIPGQLPDNEGLVPGGGKNHLRVLGIGRDLGNPSK
jgi:hypothetical protein